MLQLYFSTRCKSLLRLFRRLGIFSVVILLLILFLFLLITREAPGYYTLLLYLSIGLTWHLSRADKAFLQTYFGRKFVLLSVITFRWYISGAASVGMGYARDSIKYSALFITEEAYLFTNSNISLFMLW